VCEQNSTVVSRISGCVPALDVSTDKSSRVRFESCVPSSKNGRDQIY
jgi:hypothetical protein